MKGILVLLIWGLKFAFDGADNVCQGLMLIQHTEYGTAQPAAMIHSNFRNIKKSTCPKYKE